MKCILINRVLTIRLFLVAMVMILLLPLFSKQASASSSEMLKLPTYNTYQCTICHTVTRPTNTTAELNRFGIDFLANGKIWNKALAIKNSDGDNCPNGFELSDLNGDGQPDEPGGQEHSNPGEEDCTIALTQQTWGIIKELFSGE